MSFASDYNVFSNYHQFYTTEKTWSMIKDIVPKNKIIYEACMLNAELSNSPQTLTALTGNKVLYNTKHNFLEYHEFEDQCDIIITNPPFETDIKKKILKKLVDLDKPFIIVLNHTNIFTKYFREIFKNKLDKIQVLIPNNKLSFYCLENNNKLKEYKNMGFYSCFVAYKMDLKPDQIFL